MSSRTRIAPPTQPDLSRRFGTRPRDPLTNGIAGGPEVNERGDPMGTPAPQGPSALDNFQSGRAAPMLSSFQARQPGAVKPPAPAVGQRTGLALPRPVVAPTAPVVAPTVPQWRTPSPAPALPSNPDDRALLMATRSRDAGAQPAPVSIPSGDPGARAFWGKRSTPEPGATPVTPTAPRYAQPAPDTATLAAAGTGRTVSNPFGTGSSRNGHGDIPTDGFATSESVFHNTQAEQVAKNTLASNPFKTAMASAPTPVSTPAVPTNPGMPSRSSLLTGWATPPARAVPAGVTPSWDPLMQGPSPRIATPAPVTKPAMPAGTIPTWSGASNANAPALAPDSMALVDRQGSDLANMAASKAKANDATMSTIGAIDQANPFIARPKRKATPLMDKVAGGYGS